MSSPTRAVFEDAARQFFDEMAVELEQPRSFDTEHRNDEVAFNIEASRNRIRELDDQLRDNTFDGVVRRRAEQLAIACHGDWNELSDREQLFAWQLAARAEREQMEMLIHGLSLPGSSYLCKDNLFDMAPPPSGSTGIRAVHVAPPAGGKRYPTLAIVIDDFNAKMVKEGLGPSQIDEVGRILNWLCEEIAPSSGMDQITDDQMRAFRNNVQRMDRGRQGRASPFRKRLTDVADRQIASTTANKYWRAVQSLFAWAHAEGQAPSNPAALLKVSARKGEKPRSPEPFTTAELEHLYGAPLFTGYQSSSRLTAPGDCHQRGQHWWAGVLPLFTGLRAGELTQLLPSDFAFDAPIPHLLVQEIDGDGERTKSTKNDTAIRAVPLAPTLLVLGLRQFVERRAKTQPRARVFQRFRLGTRGKISEGMTRFWGDYLKKFGLHRPGRSTHVMRHTIIEFLRAANVAEEDIAAVVGHSNRSQTARYGRRDYPLERKLKTIDRLDFGFDVVDALGGPFDPKRHL